MNLGHYYIKRKNKKKYDPDSIFSLNKMSESEELQTYPLLSVLCSFGSYLRQSIDRRQTWRKKRRDRKWSVSSPMS